MKIGKYCSMSVEVFHGWAMDGTGHGSAAQKKTINGAENPTNLLSSKWSKSCSLNPRLAHRRVDIHRPPPRTRLPSPPPTAHRVHTDHTRIIFCGLFCKQLNVVGWQSLPRRGMIMTTITTNTITTICDRENGGGEREREPSPDPDPTQSRTDPDHICSSLNALG